MMHKMVVRRGSGWWVLVLGTVMLLWLTVSAGASAQSELMGGIRWTDGNSATFLYGELGLSPSFSVGLEAYSDVIALSGWWGRYEGMYGEIAWDSSGNSKETVEIGMWRSGTFSNWLELYGWVGAASEMRGSRLWATANAEGRIAMAQNVFASIGGTTTLFKKENVTSTWLGLGVSF